MKNFGDYAFTESIVASVRHRTIENYPTWRTFIVHDEYLFDITVLYTFYNDTRYAIACSYPHKHDESYKPEYMVVLYQLDTKPYYISHEYYPDLESLERFALWLKNHLENYLMEHCL